MLAVLDRVYTQGLAIQTDWARSNGQAVAAAASLGLITTRCTDGFGRVWRITQDGLMALEDEQ